MDSENKNRQATLALGKAPVGGLLMQYAIPAIIAMTASSLYNLVDSMFIGRGVGAMAISGLAITFPFMNLSAAFGAAIGVGSSTLISVKLGEKNYDTAQRLLGINVTLNIIVGVIFAAMSLLFLDPILRFFGASDQTIPFAREYMVVILLGNVITHLYFGMNAVLRSASKPKMAMYATIFTVVINTILDPVFIYGLHMGIRGAALATILSQLLAVCWQMKLMSNKNELLHLDRANFGLDYKLVKNIIGIGISPFAMNVCACLVVIIINNSLAHYGDDLAVGAYSIGNRVVFMFIMVCMGINQGMQPIAGYNYGARKYDRMMQVFWYAAIAATVVMTVGWIVGEFFPEMIVSIFVDTNDPLSAQLFDVAIHGLLINVMVLPLIGPQMVISNFFQSIGKAKISVFLSMSRQMIFLVPLLVVLPMYFGVDGVWASLPLSDTLAAVVAVTMMVIYLRKFKRMHQESERERIMKTDEEYLEENKQYVEPVSTNTPRCNPMNS